jgi:rRNA maturation endonuclease Nob1
MNERLELLNNVLKKIQIQDQIPEDARKELQCAGCSRTPEIGTPVFSCLEHHLLCSDCVKNNLKFCLICNQNFLQIPVTRNSLAERMITTLKR